MDYTITALQAQKRNPQRVAIFIDGEFAFGLARIVAAWLTVGQKVNDEQMAKLQEQDAQEVAYQAALRYISFRPRSTQEVRKKLEGKGFSESTLEATLRRLEQSSLLNDKQFSQSWVENREAFRPRSHRALEYELKQKGVAVEVIEQALDQVADDETLAYQAANRLAHRLSDLDRNKFLQKVGSFLSRRGFAYPVIRPVVDRLWLECHQPEANTQETSSSRIRLN